MRNETEDLNRFYFTKKLYGWWIRTWKEAKHHQLLGKCKWKQKWDTIRIGMAKILKIDHAKCWWGCGGTRTLMPCWWEHRIVQSLWKTVWQFLFSSLFWDIIDVEHCVNVRYAYWFDRFTYHKVITTLASANISILSPIITNFLSFFFCGENI